MDGLETLQEIRKVRPEQIIVMLTGQSSIQSMVEAGRLGAYDYLEKPSTPEAVHLRIQKAIEHRAVEKQLHHIQALGGGDSKPSSEKEAMADVFDLVKRVSPTDSTILVSGGTGPGKELITIHLNSPRRSNRFFALHCAAIPEELARERAVRPRKGRLHGRNDAENRLLLSPDGETRSIWTKSER